MADCVLTNLPISHVARAGAIAWDACDTNVRLSEPARLSTEGVALAVGFTRRVVRVNRGEQH